MISLIVILLTGSLFLSMLVSLGFQPKLSAALIGRIMFPIGVLGAVIYGYGYSVIIGNIPQAVMRSLFAVFCMFLGRNEISAVSAAPALQSPGMQIVIYLVHLGALYCTAGALVTAVGSRLLRVINLTLLNRRDTVLICGTDSDLLSFGEKMQRKDRVVIFIGQDQSPENRILQMGSILFTDGKALHPDASFLRRLGFPRGERKLSVYLLSTDTGKNLQYAEEMKKALQDAGMEPRLTSLTMLGDDAADGRLLQVSQNSYGYGSTEIFEPAELAARVLMLKQPPYYTMHFDGRGHAEEDFEAVVIGFGSTGQAVLRYLIMNGQFCRSHFHAVVVEDAFAARAGSFLYKYPGLRDLYNIEFREENARSISFYDYLYVKRNTLNYVAVCTGNEKENGEIAQELTNFLREAGSRAEVIQCSTSGITRLNEETGVPEKTGIFTPQILDSTALDHRAMILNHQYHRNEGNTVEEDWQNCDYFSRMSCRASADFLDAILYSASLRKEDAANGIFLQDEDLLNTLGEAEHMRWVAFHACMRYQKMSDAQFIQRAERKRNGEDLRVNKDECTRTHACMVPWEELPALDKKEEELTGIRKNYQEMDKDNIRMIPEMLKEEMTS